jgi:Acyl-CoA dehydrogenase N terminal
MPSYKAPLEDVSFLLNDVFQIDRYNNLPGFNDASADVRQAILIEAAKLSEEVLQPLNRVGDLEGCTRHDDGRVTTPSGFKEAFRQVAEGGWLGLSAPAEYGGQGLADHADADGHRVPDVGQHGVFNVYKLGPGCDSGAAGTRQARTESDVRAKDGGGRVDRHDEPHRTAVRH